MDDAGSLGKDKRVAIVLELKVEHGDADAAGYVGDLAGVDFLRYGAAAIEQLTVALPAPIVFAT